MEWASKKQMVPERLLTALMVSYVGTKLKVRTVAGISEELEIGVGVHQR